MMHIKLKNKKLYFGNYKIKCAIGKRGISRKKREGDGCTPKGAFKFKYLLYRKDKIFKIRSYLKKITIKKNMGWCDDPGSKKYNRLIKFPFSEKAEKLFLKKKSYDLLLVISYNRRPIVPHKGSAIFLHIANKKFSPTKGCVAIKKKDFLKILPMIRKKTKIIIN